MRADLNSYSNRALMVLEPSSYTKQNIKHWQDLNYTPTSAELAIVSLSLYDTDYNINNIQNQQNYSPHLYRRHDNRHSSWT